MWPEPFWTIHSFLSCISIKFCWIITILFASLLVFQKRTRLLTFNRERTLFSFYVSVQHVCINHSLFSISKYDLPLVDTNPCKKSLIHNSHLVTLILGIKKTTSSADLGLKKTTSSTDLGLDVKSCILSRCTVAYFDHFQCVYTFFIKFQIKYLRYFILP